MKVLYLDRGDVMTSPTAVCLGFFDGVHIGHVQLIRRAQVIAREKGLLSCVHTFDEMPARVVHPSEEIMELTPLPQKLARLEGMRVDAVAISHFRSTMRMPAEVFFEEVLVRKLDARHIVAGFHHRFGHEGKGDVRLLQSLCAGHGIGLDIIAPVRLADGTLISSTAIRAALTSGDGPLAARMLGWEKNQG